MRAQPSDHSMTKSATDENDVYAAKTKLGMPLRSGRTGLATKGQKARFPLIGPHAFYNCAKRITRLRSRVIPNSRITHIIPEALRGSIA